MNSASQVLRVLQHRGWTYAAIADELGVHRGTVWRWSDERHTPRNKDAVLETLSRLLLIRPPRGRRHRIRRELLDGIYNSRTCRMCGQDKPLERFTGTNMVCKDCRRRK